MMAAASFNLWAVHISDSVLAEPFWLAGFGMMALLALAGAWRVRDDEIPRIALLTSAFFVASLIHVPVGPSRAHLLLNGLMGVLLGWRAALAIPLAVLLQAVLFGHGGFTTIGINSCVMTLPAIVAGYLFAGLHRLPWLGRPWFQAGLVGISCFIWVLSLTYSIVLLTGHLDPQNTDPEKVAAILASANFITFHPLTLCGALVLAAIGVVIERRLENTAEFPLGLLVGELTVLATVGLNYLVLIAGGEQNWSLPATVLVVLHLPLAVIEGVVLGFSVGLLARVRPDMLGVRKAQRPEDEHAAPQRHEVPAAPPPARVGAEHNLPSAICNPKSLALLVLFAVSSPTQAHRLEGDYKVLPGQKVRIESWFDLGGDAVAGAAVQAFRADGELVANGTLDDKGIFIFSYPRPEALRVVISAGEGHRKELQIAKSELVQVTPESDTPPTPSSSPESPSADRSSRISVKDVVIGLSFLLALAAFALSWRNARHIRQWDGKPR